MHEIGCRHDDPSADLEQLGCLPQQFRCVSNVLDDVSEKDGCEFALDFAQSLGLEIGLMYLRTHAPGSLRQSRILLDADDGAVLLHGQVFGQVTGPAPDVQYRFPIVEEFCALQHVAASFMVLLAASRSRRRKRESSLPNLRLRTSPATPQR